MKRISILSTFLMVCWLGATSLAFGTSVVVSQSGTGQVTLVDESGIKTTLVSGLDEPYMVKYDKIGNLFVFEYRSLRVSRIDPAGHATVFVNNLPGSITDKDGNQLTLSYLDLTVSDDNKVFLLVRLHDASGYPHLTEVWKLTPGASPTVIASFVAMTYRFTFGPGGYLYLAANGKDDKYNSQFNNPNNHIIRVSLIGEVSSFYQFPWPNIGNDGTKGVDLLSVRFASDGAMFLLTHNPSGPNYRDIWKIQSGVASLFAELGNGPADVGSGALSMTIDAADNLFVVGGGTQCSGPPHSRVRMDSFRKWTTLEMSPPWHCFRIIQI